MHTGTRADFFFGMYQLETRFARIRKMRTKKAKKADRSSEKCDARRSESLQEETSVLKRNRQQTSAARTKQHEDEEEDTGIRPAGREK